jgi:hypothetical protein
MLNNIYSTPLHGVECFFESRKNTSLPLSLQLREDTIVIPPNAKALWTVQDQSKNYTTNIFLYELSDNAILIDIQCEGVGKFLIHNNTMTIDWEENGTDSAHYFQSIAIALWLELKQVLCIHANVLEHDGKCIALIGPSGMGKSTLSAYLQQQGFTWLTDDMMAVHGLPSISDSTNKTIGGIVYPSWPQARMWPDSVDQFESEQLSATNKVHTRFSKMHMSLPQSNAEKALRLDAIYVLSREGANLSSLSQNNTLMVGNKNASYLVPANTVNSINQVNATSALMALLQNSMLGGAFASLGIEKERLSRLSTLVNKVPVKQIHYASRYEDLATVHALIKHDIESL